MVAQGFLPRPPQPGYQLLITQWKRRTRCSLDLRKALSVRGPARGVQPPNPCVHCVPPPSARAHRRTRASACVRGRAPEASTIPTCLAAADSMRASYTPPGQACAHSHIRTHVGRASAGSRFGGTSSRFCGLLVLLVLLLLCLLRAGLFLVMLFSLCFFWAASYPACFAGRHAHSRMVIGLHYGLMSRLPSSHLRH